MSWRGANALYVARKLGLTANLEYCIDPGDAASYDGSSQTLADLSANGMDFYLGPTSGSEASDPTFNGTPGGLSKAEYFSNDGGDYFRLASGSNPTWVENLHKDNAVGTLAGWFKIVPAGLDYFFATRGGGANAGARLSTSAGGNLAWVVGTGAGTAFNYTSGPNVASVIGSGWGFIAASVDEGGNSLVLKVNASVVSAGCTYSSPTTDPAQGPLAIGAAPNGTAINPSGTLYGPCWGWSRALSAGELAALFDATRGRFQV